MTPTLLRLRDAAVGLALILAPCQSIHAQSYTWRTAEVGGGGFVTGTVFHPTEPGLVYARTDVGGAYRLDSATNRWIALNDAVGGTNNEFQHLGVLTIGLDPNDANRVYLASGQYGGAESWKLPSRIYRSTDRGATWSYTTPGFKMAGNGEGRGTGERMAVDPLNGANLLVGTSDSGIWRSTDHGASWTRMTNFTPANCNFVLYAPANTANPGPNRRAYAAAYTLAGPSLWSSDDNGSTWISVANQPGLMAGAELMALQGSFDAAGTFYTTWGDQSGPSNSMTRSEVWKLAADGATWSQIQPPAGQGGFAGIGADPRVAGHVVVSTLHRWWPGDEIYRSTDGGTTWTAALRTGTRATGNSPWSSTLSPHWITDIDIDPFNSERAIFNTGGGLFQTTNLASSGSARTWTFFNDGLEELVPLGLLSPTAGPPLVTVTGDYTGWRHDDLNRSPLRGRHSPGNGSNSRITGADLAPEKMIRQNSTATYYSQDAATTWSAFPTEPPTVTNGHGAAVLSADGQRVLWCPTTSEAYVSADAGATWTASGGTALGVTLTPIADRVNSQLFYLWNNTAKSLLISTDGGQNFTTAASGMNTAFSIFRSVPGQSGHLWVAANSSGLYKSTNSGTSFTKLSSVTEVYRFDFGRAAPGATHPAVFIWGKVGTIVGFFRSDDAGATWIRINDNLHNFGYQNDLVADSRVHGRVYLATSGRGVVIGEMTSNPASQASQLVYTDSLQGGWVDASPADTSLSASAPVRRGTSAISVPAGSNKGASFTCSARSLQGIAALSFWVNAANSAPLQVGGSRGGIALEAVPVATSPAPGWQRVVVPLSELGLAGIEDLTGIRIESRTVSGVTPGAFVIDDVVLVGTDDFATPPPAVAITISNLSATYDGTPKPVSVTTDPAGTAVSVTYNGSASIPVSGGSYAVSAVVDHPLSASSASATLVIAKAPATVSLENLAAAYDGTPKNATATTTPAGLPVNFTYNGSSSAPVQTGSYTVVATIASSDYAGSSIGTFVIIADMLAYQNWRIANFGSSENSGNAADGADPDGDGFSNIEEYSAGTNPLSATSFPAPAVVITSPSTAAVSLADTADALRVAASVSPATGPLAVSWTKVSGPGAVSFANPAAADTTASFTAPGIYQIQCAATLGTAPDTATGTDLLTVSVAMPSVRTFRQGENGYSHTATIIRADNTAWNSGARDQVLVGKTSYNMRTVFSFDLSTIPADFEVASVQLDLWTSATAGSGTVGALELRPLLGTPTEGTGDGITATNGAGTGATWASRTGATTAGNLWTTAGGDFSSTVLSTVPGFSATATGVQKSFASSAGFVASVDSAVASGQPLNLMLFSPLTEAGPVTQFTRLASDDASNMAQRPRLTVSLVANALPDVAAGTSPPATRDIPANLAGSATNADSVLWTKLSGPGSASFAAATQSATTVTFSQAGNYVLQLAATNAIGQSSATLAITVNAPPVAPGGDLTVSANTAGEIILPMSDPDSDPLVVQSFTQGSNGAVTLNGITATYTPAANFTGSDSFSYTVADGKGGSATGTIVVTINDTLPPVVSVPANMTLEATGPSGAAASFSTSALDDVNGPLPTSNTPGSGSVFPLGTTTVTASATDSAGNTGSASFTITVRDTTAPVITVPANITVAATSGNGATVTFSTTASDTVNGSLATNNNPASGSLFPVGTTTVTTTATDLAGNFASRSFTVTVGAWNSAPALAAIGNKSVNQGENLAFTAVATDTDVPTQTLTYSLDAGAPAGATIHATTGAFSWTPSGAQAAGTYPITIRVTDSGIPAKDDFETITVTVTSSLPSPWVTQDIGSVGLTGSATYSAGSYTLAGAGAGITGTADACRFAYQTASGDCDIIVRVQSLTGTVSKAGVMIRETLSANSREAGVWITPASGAQFTLRTSAGGSTSVTSSTGKVAPYWVRLTRSGNSFKAFMSANGSTWTQLGKNTNIPMAASTYIGLAVTSGSTATLCTGVMTNDAVTP